MGLPLTVAPLLALQRIEDVNLLAYLTAFGGGVVSFLSPCVLPLVPGYLSMVTGLDIAQLREDSRKHVRGIVTTTGLFVAGFGTVFVLLGLSASAAGGLLADHKDVLTRVSGMLMVAMALFLAGSIVLRLPWLYQEARFHPQLGKYGNAAPVIAGVAFGFGWSPCLGPVLGSILAIAANEGRALAGATLLATYTLGLGLPFLVAGLALGRLGGTLDWVKRHSTSVVLVSAAMLGAFGVLLMFDQLSRLSAELIKFLDRMGLDWLVELG